MDDDAITNAKSPKPEAEAIEIGANLSSNSEGGFAETGEDGNVPSIDTFSTSDGPRWAELERVLRDEQEHLTEARDAEARRKNPLGVPVGLALSGGGIRSATFCLGVLQALAQRGWIRRIDYLSTVSGGGYIGSWLSACIYRARKTGTADPIGEVEKRIAPRTIRRNGEEPTEIRFLRAYSNYLTPRLGVFSGDTLAAFAGSLRNLGLNLILGLISVCVILAALHWMIAWLFAATHSRTGVSFLGALASAAIFVAFAGVAAFLTLQSYDIRKFVATAPTKMVLEAFTILQRQPRWFVSYPLALGLVAGGGWLGVYGPAVGRLEIVGAALSLLVALGVGSLYAYMLLEIPAYLPPHGHPVPKSFDFLQLMIKGALRGLLDARGDVGRYVIACVVCATAAYGLVTAASLGLGSSARPDLAMDLQSALRLAVLGPVSAVAGLWLLYVLWMGVAGNTYSEFSRDWLNRLFGGLLGFAALWLVVGAVLFHARPAWYWVASQWAPLDRRNLLSVVIAIAVAGIVLFASWWSLSRKRKAATKKEEDPFIVNFLCTLAVFVVASLLTVAYQSALAMLATRGVGMTLPNEPGYDEILKAHFSQLTLGLSVGTASLLEPSSWPFLVPSLTFLVVLGGLAWAAFRAVDVNTFSLQNLYRNRLVRCYLGAPHHQERLENPYAGFDPRDDFELSVLADQRPYHLINAALNITQGQDLAWQQRKAASFVFTPRWCGFWLESTEASNIVSRDPLKGGYVRTDCFVQEPAGFREVSKGVMVGTAMATSGAAVSSQMGFASRGPLAFVLTLINVRLGRWLPNPARRDKETLWSRNSPRLGAFWYLRELLGMTTERSEWVYASDGGHFENLGIYELVRRRCGLIICVDAAADPHRTFGDLGNAVGKCRVDFGVDIKLNTEELQIDPTDRRSKNSFAIGTIDYPDAQESPAFKGNFLYIKPSIPRWDERLPADILSYWARHREFPHEPTIDQWFTESQFESYRQLGFVVGLEAFARAQDMFDELASPRKGTPDSAVSATRKPSAIPADQLMWVFGYGSLMWDGWETERGCNRRCTAKLRRYRRVFDKASTKRWGNKEHPCPTLNLEQFDPGNCRGMAFAFPRERASDIRKYLLDREGEGFRLQELAVEFDDGTSVQALVPIYEGKKLLRSMSPEDTAAMIGSAAGEAGSCAEYVSGIARKLAELGIDDPDVERMQKVLSVISG